jgi:hypothetical protein
MTAVVLLVACISHTENCPDLEFIVAENVVQQIILYIVALSTFPVVLLKVQFYQPQIFHMNLE